jgi:general secretion pathway protein E/type IV pilus assembly protein PilB
MGISDSFPKLASCGPDGVPALVDALIAEARRRRASDLHLEPGKNCVLARLRVDGVLEQLAELPLALAPNLAARCKILAGLLTYRLDIPQEGGFRDTIGEGRISTFPVVYGEKVVFRFFQSERLDDLANLGFDTAIVGGLMQALDLRDGMLLVTGPSGSGKTTTIYTCLQRLAAAGRQVCTLEDPVEYPVTMMRQTSVAEVNKVDFANGIRSIMRQDPDIILVGEMRDHDTAEMAFRAAMTGHQVFSTLHTNSALGTFPRLLDIGISPDIMSGNIIGVVAQRLVRVLCQHCKEA